MKKTPRFLLCSNPLVEPDKRYILCTRKPKALFEVIYPDPEKFQLVLQELYEGSPNELEDAFKRGRNWYIAYLSGKISPEDN